MIIFQNHIYITEILVNWGQFKNICLNVGQYFFSLFQFHVDKKGRVNFAQTDVLIHVVNKQTNRILDVERSEYQSISFHISFCFQL